MDGGTGGRSDGWMHRSMYGKLAEIKAVFYCSLNFLFLVFTLRGIALNTLR